MSYRLSRRDRKIAIAGVIVCTTLLLSRGMPGWLAWRAATRERAAEAADELARSEAAVRAQHMIRDSVAAGGRRYAALAPLLVGGGIKTSPDGILAGFVSDAAGEANLRVTNLQVQLDSATSSTFTRVSVRTTATGDIRGLTRLLETLEQGPMLLAVRELVVSQPEPAAPNARPEALRMELRVEGLALTRAATTVVQ